MVAVVRVLRGPAVRILGIDTGSVTHGIAVIDLPHPRSVAQYLWHYGRGDDIDAVYQVTSRVGHAGLDLVVLEVPEGPHGGMGHGQAIAAGRAFAAASKHAVAIAEAAGRAGVRVVQVTAREVRRALGCGNTDAGVKRAVGRLVAGWPVRSSCHARDAAAAALVGARR